MGAIQIVTIGAIALAIFITWLKRLTRRGTFWRGGVVAVIVKFHYLLGVGALLDRFREARPNHVMLEHPSAQACVVPDLGNDDPRPAWGRVRVLP